MQHVVASPFKLALVDVMNVACATAAALGMHLEVRSERRSLCHSRCRDTDRGRLVPHSMPHCHKASCSGRKESPFFIGAKASFSIKHMMVRAKVLLEMHLACKSWSAVRTGGTGRSLVHDVDRVRRSKDGSFVFVTSHSHIARRSHILASQRRRETLEIYRDQCPGGRERRSARFLPSPASCL